MNKTEFTGYLEDIHSLSSESVAGIFELVHEFPYCQSARILHTLNLYTNNDIRYDSELKTTAVYANNRGLLRKYIDSLSTDNIKVALPDEGVTKQKEPVKQKVETVGNGIEQKKVEPKVKPKVEPILSAEKGVDKDTELHYDAESIAEVKSILERHIRELEIENEHSSSESVKVNKKPTTSKNKNDIISDFIKNEPSISRPKARFYDPVDKANESIVDNENIVSETLAGIYHDQGYLLKAIKIYQKLSLKFPEKSSYFAALIKKAEKELKS